MENTSSSTSTSNPTESLEKKIFSLARRARYDYIMIIIIGVTFAILLRLSLIEFKSIDFIGYFRPWFNELKLHGFHSFKSNFYDYYPPYLYLVYLLVRFFPNAPAIIVTKIPSMTADFVCAFFVYLIVRFKMRTGAVPIFAALVTLFAPTVVINSAFWGQTDALYAAAILVGLYFLINNKKMSALFFIGIAFSFKAQTIFLAPLLLGLFLKKEINWKHLLLIPLVMALALVPTWMAGRPLLDLLQIYPAQAGEFEQLTLNAPSLYALLPDNPQTYQVFFPMGIALSGILVLLFSFLIFKSSAKLTPGLLIELALISFMIIPFFLPKMHERYFYPADVISIVFAAYFPGYFFVPVVMGAISFYAYLPYLFGQEPIPMSVLALALFFLICTVTWHTLRDLFPAKTANMEDKP